MCEASKQLGRPLTALAYQGQHANTGAHWVRISNSVLKFPLHVLDVLGRKIIHLNVHFTWFCIVGVRFAESCFNFHCAISESWIVRRIHVMSRAARINMRRMHHVSDDATWHMHTNQLNSISIVSFGRSISFRAIWCSWFQGLDPADRAVPVCRGTAFQGRKSIPTFQSWIESFL
jgi:hypothetical protein